MRKSLLRTGLCMVLTATLVGCGSSGATKSDKTAKKTASAASDKKGSTKPVTLSVFVNHLPNPSDWKWGADPTSKEITKETGVTCDIQYASDSDNSEITTMLASGEKLPDIIVTDAHGPIRPMLVDQGFALPLNKLADKYYPEFWKTLPKDMDKVYEEDDGNFYCVADFYGDASRYKDQILNSRGSTSMTIKKDYYDEIGRPEIKTLDEYKTAIKAIMSKHPDIENPVWDQRPNAPWLATSLLNMFARMYGATNNYFDFDGDQVKMVFQTDYYKKALKEYNSFYREGLINPEQYTFKDDQVKGIYAAQNVIAYNGCYWDVLQGMNTFDKVIYETIDYPMPEGKSSDQMKIHDDYYGIGGTGVFISKDAAAPDRCIQYLSFLLSDKGQILQRYGAEGVTWTKDDQGRPKQTDVKTKTEQEDFAKLQRKYGVYNYDFSWLTSQWAIAYGAHNTYQAFSATLPDYKMMEPHQQNETYADLTYTLNDTDALALKEQIYQLWASGVAKICTAKDDDTFEKEYKTFLSDMKTAGVEKLNDYYQKNAKHWEKLGFKK